jgi:hypothetical protein
MCNSCAIRFKHTSIKTAHSIIITDASTKNIKNIRTKNETVTACSLYRKKIPPSIAMTTDVIIIVIGDFLGTLFPLHSDNVRELIKIHF